jgi:ureidoacrylate peracid hydrolase
MRQGTVIEWQADEIRVFQPLHHFDQGNEIPAPRAPVEVPQAREIVSTVNAISTAVRKAGGVNVFVRYVSRSDDARKWSTFYSTMLPQVSALHLSRHFLQDSTV